MKSSQVKLINKTISVELCGRVWGADRKDSSVKAMKKSNFQEMAQHNTVREIAVSAGKGNVKKDR